MTNPEPSELAVRTTSRWGRFWRLIGSGDTNHPGPQTAACTEPVLVLTERFSLHFHLKFNFLDPADVTLNVPGQYRPAAIGNRSTAEFSSVGQ